MKETKVVLQDKEIPKQWYNIMADMPNLPRPPLHRDYEYPAEKIKEALSKLPVF